MDPTDSLDDILRPQRFSERVRARWATPSADRAPSASVRLVAVAVAVVVGVATVVAIVARPPQSVGVATLPQASVPDVGGERAPSDASSGAVGEGAGGAGAGGAAGAEAGIAGQGAAGAGEWVVHVAGAVLEPGLVTLSPGSRVGDAIAAAGGPAAVADLDAINLAEVLADGVRVRVPAVGETPPANASALDASGAARNGAGSASGGDGGLININTASVEELQQLPGVGPSTAEAIVAHRDKHGPFSSPDALDDVRGIGPAKLSALLDLVAT